MKDTTETRVEAILPALCTAGDRPKMRDVAIRTALACAISYEDIIGDSRVRRCSWPRQYAMFICKEMGLGSLVAIGTAFGGRDHTTVIHSINAVERRMNSGVRAALDQITADVRASRLSGRPQ